MVALADLLSFVYLFSQTDDLALQFRYNFLKFTHFLSFLIVFCLILIPDNLDPLLFSIQFLHLLGLLLQLVLLAQQFPLQLHLMVDIQLLHLKQKFLIIGNGLYQPSDALYYLGCLMLIFAVLFVAFVESIEQHA